MLPSVDTPAVSLLELGGLTVDLRTGVTDRGGPPLTALERSVLRRLAAARGRPVSHAALLVDVWGYAPDSRSRAVATTIARLRKHIEDDPTAPRRLLTVHGEGYLLPKEAPPRERPVEGLRDERAALLRWVAGPGRLISILGGGGTGKSCLLSQLRRQTSHTAADRFPGGFPLLDHDELGEGLPQRLPAALATASSLCFLDLQDRVPATFGADLPRLLRASRARVVLATRVALDMRGEALLPLRALGLAPGPGGDRDAAAPARHQSLQANRRSTLAVLPPSCLDPRGELKPLRDLTSSQLADLARAGLLGWNDAGEPEVSPWITGSQP